MATHIVFEPMFGCWRHEAIKEANALAGKTQLPVKFMFNGDAYMCEPSMTMTVEPKETKQETN